MFTGIVDLSQAGTAPLAQVGGKAQALGRLIALDAPVPPGFVVPPATALGADLITAFDCLNCPYVAVRSSAAGEDAPGKSWAGQFESYLYVTRDHLLGRIRDCRASGKSHRAQAYDVSGGSMPVAVIVQAMVPSDVAGVMFTANPVTKNRQEIMIEAVYGLGEQLVQGLATPDNYVLAKPEGDVKTQTISPKAAMLVGSEQGITEQSVPAGLRDQATLSTNQCQELARMAVRLEAAFGYPLDIEFAYHKDQLFIVQGRPITTI